MAAQSLYRRYRPRRFSELKGQPHVVRALQSAVINNREGQAYLFSGPRGTGKTTSARILAKVLNCENPIDGEPCCECASCLAVEAGNSYDVHELDAASNNGVDAMRDLIEKASLGTPGRHKVYILDEVHMLSKPAEAALLKTLEEPPPHVVFVLATTDPQKISDTIRSRTQHLQFHLLDADELAEHVRWVASDAGITVDDATVAAVVRQGGGSARDTLSSLELAASSGGMVDEGAPVDEFVEALQAADAARVLAAVAFSVQQGRDPRALTEELIRHLRECFLSLMAPELVQLPAARAEQVHAQATRLGAALLVKAMETLGEILVEMRHAPDPRVLVEVALVRLTHRELATGVEALAARVEHLEAELARLQASGPVAASAPDLDPTSGRARIGSRAGRAAGDATGGIARPAPAASAAPVASSPVREPAEPASPPAAPPAADEAPAPPSQPPPSTPSPGASERPAQASRPAATDTPSAPPGPQPGGQAGDPAAKAAAAWTSEVVPSLKGLTRAMISAATLVGVRDGSLAIAAPNDVTRQKLEQQRVEIEAAVAKIAGSPVPLIFLVDGAPSEAADTPGPRAAAPPIEEEVIDPDELLDAPPAAVLSPVERLTQAFPGSELLEGRD